MQIRYGVYDEIYPEIIEEMKGFAEGMKLDFWNVFTLFVSMYVFAFDNYCTCLAISNENGAFLERNSDFDIRIKE